MKSRFRRTVLVSLLVCLAAQQVATAADQATTQAREERMQWWREARFGMFVHWGLYSGLAGTWDGKPVANRGGMEWIQNRVKADTDTYAERAIPLFKPKAGFARAWAKLAKQAGCEYLVFTTKHHDGFALHDSAVSDFDAGSILGRDLVKEIVEACRAEGLRVGFYHSVIDWHHDQYAYAKSTILPHPLREKPYPNGERDHSTYIAFLHDQVKELMSGYGPVDVLWWDYSATDFQGDEAWQAFALMEKVRQDQPQVIMNNRLFRSAEAGWKGMGTDGFTMQLDPTYGDFITPEQHVPDEGMPGIDWETCMTMNTTWGYSEHDDAWKSTETLLHKLVEIVSKGGNYLLNIGPTGDGTVPAESVERLEAIGAWMAVNGEAIHGATVSQLPSPAWGRVTERRDGEVCYLCVFERPEDGILAIDGTAGAWGDAVLLGTGESLASEQSEGTLRIHLPADTADCVVPVIRLSRLKAASKPQ